LWLVLFYALISVGIAHGQSGSNPPPESLRTILNNLDEVALSGEGQAIETEQQALELAQNLRQANNAAASWKTLYEESLMHLDEARKALEESRIAQEDSRIASDQFTMDFNALSQSSTAYRVEAEAQITAVQRERDLWRWGAIGAGIVAVIAWIVAALK
jgi:hypothetical protein